MADQEEWMEEDGIVPFDIRDDAVIDIHNATDDSLASSSVTPYTTPCDVTKSGRVIKKSSKILEMEIAEKVEKLAKSLTSAKSTFHKKSKVKPVKTSPAIAPLRLSLSSPLAGKGSAPVAAQLARVVSPVKGGRSKKQTVTVEHTAVPSSTGLDQSHKLPMKSLIRPTYRDTDVAGDAAVLVNMKKKKMKVFTAYVLWCNEQRAQLLAQKPDLDFVSISRRLADIWQTVPEKEKMIWRRKARKLTQKSSSMISTGKTKTGRVGRPSLGSRADVKPITAAVAAVVPSREKVVADATPVVTFKVTGTDHIDVAAHLKLLGESLTVIGARLQEHKGQIAVQGSLSVLLDSLLCALGPVMCLTNQIPELNGCPESVHTSTLDNIAYIMPGVG